MSILPPLSLRASRVNIRSIHPPSIIKQLPSRINERISSLVMRCKGIRKSNPGIQRDLTKKWFHATASLHRQDQYKHRKEQEQIKTSQHSVVQPPLQSICTKRCGPRIPDHEAERDEFPKGHVLRKILNRNTIKVSYSCMGNMKSTINRHMPRFSKLKHQLKERVAIAEKNSRCPLNTACLTESLVYKATVLAENHEPQTYIGMTEHNFKTRFRSHKMSFENLNYRSSTTLSKYICNFNCREENPFKQKIRAVGQIRHRNKFYAANYKPPRV